MSGSASVGSPGRGADTGASGGAVAERFALELAQGGMQRMVARVLAALLFSERDAVTAGELGAQLGASAGSISAALKMLRTTALIERVPAPQSRRDHYRLRAGAWATLMSSQNSMLTLMCEIAEDGLAEAVAGGPAAARLAEMHEFYTYLLAELPALLERWERSRAARLPPT